MDMLWNSMPVGGGGSDIRSSTLPRSFGSRSGPRRGLTDFPRVFAGRDRRMGDYRRASNGFGDDFGSGFGDDMFPSSFTHNDDIAHRINIHRDNSSSNRSSTMDEKPFMVSSLSPEIDDMFRNHKPVLTSSTATRDIPIQHGGHGSHGSHDMSSGSSHVIPISRDTDDWNRGFSSGPPEAFHHESRAPPEYNSYRPGSAGRNVRFADDDTHSNHSDADATRRHHIHREGDDRNAENKPQAATEGEEEKEPALVVKSVDCHIADNTKVHNTDMFQQVEQGQLIVRRGQKFEVTAVLNRVFNVHKDQLSITFSTGNKPQPGKGNYVNLKVPDRVFSAVWFAEIISNTDGKVRIAIRPDVTCIVGEWKMAIHPVHVKKDGDEKDRFLMLYGKSAPETPLYILFNPWNKDDHTFFPDSSKLAEYVLNDSGCIFTGTEKQIEAKPWFYGQFELGVLEAAVYCLRKAFNFQSTKAMGDPAKVSRAISRIVNSNDDNGVVVGNWSGNYTDGRSPQLWVGSVSILRNYYNKKRSVKYGQCFVFAGVVTTICRALGLPCRPVTNFCSVHDSDGSVTFDVHWDLAENREISELNTDSMWNFHVWNDVWMARKDIGFGNDGWQVVDATPQETSGGKFSCGPAPHTAILNGRCDVNFDTPFIFAEVNADRVHWGRQKDGTWSVIAIDKAATGKKLCTKTADGRPVPASLSHCDNFREDITPQYKHTEESPRERLSVVLANSLSPRARKDLYNKDDTTMELELKCPDHLLVGADIIITVSCKNKSAEQRTVQGKLLVDVITYTGKTIKTCKEEDVVIKMGTYDKSTHTVHIKAEEYMRYVSEGALMKVSLLAKAVDTDQVFAKQDSFRLRTPDLKLKCFNSTCQVGRPLSLQCSFKNPLQDRPLTNCYVYAECSGMEQPKLVTMRNVPPGREMTCDLDMTVTQRGRRQLIATFFCNEINDIQGVLDIYLQTP